MSRQTPPHNIPISAKITHLSHDGRGITQINGKTTFLFGGLSGETVEFIYETKHSRFDEGQVQKVVAHPHHNRVSPPCKHFGICGGCQLQQLDFLAQTQHKVDMLIELFNQQSITPTRLLTPLVSQPWFYRRKARLSVKFIKGQLHVGFRERKSASIANIESCMVLDKKIANKIASLRELLQNFSIRQAIPQIEVAIADNASALIIRHLLPFSKQDIDQLNDFADKNKLILFLQPGGLETIHPLSQSISVKHFLYYELPDFNLKLFFAPQHFIQVNALINQKMIAQALQLLDLNPNDKVLDLFCGLGNFSLPLAKYCHTLTGIEGEYSAIEQAQYNAKFNQLQNCNFYCADLANLPWLQTWAQLKYDKILLDPPRTGAALLCENILKWQPKIVLYISCNPSTLVRDAKILQNKGYYLHTLGAMDMFPQTKHLEAMALFKRN